ncbi:hypothetical protein YC2023_054135 [Brassica napus]
MAENRGGGGCCPPMDLMRSEPMQLVQVIVPMESAHLTVSYRQRLQRTYAAQVNFMEALSEGNFDEAIEHPTSAVIFVLLLVHRHHSCEFLPCHRFSYTGTKCLADLCGALHCDFVLSSKKAKSKCNPAAAAKNRHLCEVSFFVMFILLLR